MGRLLNLLGVIAIVVGVVPIWITLEKAPNFTSLGIFIATGIPAFGAILILGGLGLCGLGRVVILLERIADKPDVL